MLSFTPREPPDARRLNVLLRQLPRRRRRSIVPELAGWLLTAICAAFIGAVVIAAVR